MSENNGRTQSVMVRMAERVGMDLQKFERTLMATTIRGGKATPEQVAAFLLICDRYGLDPFLKEVHAIPARDGGITTTVGVDGWLRIINSHPQFNGMEFEYHETSLEGGERRLDAITCIIHRKDREFPTRVTEYMEECRRNTDPWRTSPRRQLRHKSIIQGGRVAFAITGLVDEEDGEIIAARDHSRIIDASARDMDALKQKLIAERAAVAPPPEPEPEDEDPMAGSVEDGALFEEA